MSKMDDLRAMREARYEAARAAKPGASTTTAAAQPQAAAAPKAVEPAANTPTSELTEPEAALCGHRDMSGRTCTREAGHAAKSHRYS